MHRVCASSTKIQIKLNKKGVFSIKTKYIRLQYLLQWNKCMSKSRIVLKFTVDSKHRETGTNKEIDLLDNA